MAAKLPWKARICPVTIGMSRGKLWTLALVLWIGAVLLRYQRVESPEPLAALGLALGWLVVLTMACLGPGLPLVRCLHGARLPRLERLVLGVGVGSGVLMAAAAGLALLHLLRPTSVTVTLTIATLAGVPAALRELRGVPRLACRGSWIPILMLAVASGVTLLAVLTPSPFYDQLHYHLAFPFHWLRSGTLTVFPRHSYSFFPANMGLLFAYALATFGPWAAQAIHWWTGAVAVAATGALAARLAGPRAGWRGAALLALTPSVLLVATWAAADLGTTAFAACAWLAIMAAHRDPDLGQRRSWWGLAGALAGLACGCKLLGLAVVAAPLAMVACLVGPARGWPRLTRQALPLALGVTLAFAPWAARNLALTGNPLYPFLAGWLGGTPGGTATPGAAHGAQAIARLGSPLAAPLQVLTLTTFEPGGDAGAIGPLYLALAPLAFWAVARCRRRGAGILVAGVLLGALGWAMGPPLGRYALPLLVPLAALEAAGLTLLRTHVTRKWWSLVDGLLALALTWNLVGGMSALELRRLAASLGRADSQEIMRAYASYYSAVRFVNEELPAGARILLVGESRAMYLDRDVDVEDPFQVPRLVELARSCMTPEEIAGRLRSDGITHVLINWHEARRIAELNRREEYFAPLAPPERERLEAFLARGTVLLLREQHVEVRALLPAN